MGHEFLDDAPWEGQDIHLFRSEEDVNSLKRPSQRIVPGKPGQILPRLGYVRLTSRDSAHKGAHERRFPKHDDTGFRGM